MSDQQFYQLTMAETILEHFKLTIDKSLLLFFSLSSCLSVDINLKSVLNGKGHYFKGHGLPNSRNKHLCSRADGSPDLSTQVERSSSTSLSLVRLH